MDVTAKYELIGLMAYPIRHSLSPEMQNKALEKAGLPFTYMAFEVDNDSFPAAIEGLKALKMRGTGVSMPNKQLACEYVDELTPAAKLVGAINTIVNDDGYLRGYKEGANKRGNSSRLTQSFHFFMFEPIFSPVNALNQPI